MVYFKPVLASAVAFTLISTTAALPASIKRDNTVNSNFSNNISTDNNNGGNHNDSGSTGKRSINNGPVIVQAKSVKRGYVGGGHSKGLKQAPLVKASKMLKTKRDVVEA